MSPRGDSSIYRPPLSPAYFIERPQFEPLPTVVVPPEDPPPDPTPGPVGSGDPATPPAPALFRFIAEDILSGRVTTQDLPLENWSYDDTLNRAGALQASIPLTSTFATEEILAPWRTAIYVMRNGRIEWGGILKPPQLSDKAASLSIACEGWLGYWDHRTIRRDYQPVQVDQFEIFQHLIVDAQDELFWGDGYDLHIDVVWDALSGVLRDRSEEYQAFNAKNLGEALRQLAAVDDGFDYSMTYTVNTVTNRIDKAIKLFYPFKGRTTDYLFEYERGVKTNVISRGFADPVDFAWVGDGWGSGNDATRVRTVYVDETLRGVYPPYDAAPTFSSVSTQSVLDENTVAAFGRRNRPKRVPVLTVDPNAYPQWGDAEIGDTVNYRIIDGYGSTGIIPRQTRIVGTNVNAAGEYQLVLEATAADLDVSPVVVVVPPVLPPPPDPPPDVPVFEFAAYGAVGNGIIDDTAALQAALNAAAARVGGGTVHATPGAVYMISAGLYFRSNVVLSGTGATIRNLTSRTNGTIMLYPDTAGVSNFTVTGVTFDQRRDYYEPLFGYATDQPCLDFSHTSFSVVQDCSFVNIRTDAVYAAGDSTHPVATLTVQRNHVYDASGSGIEISGKATSLVVYANTVESTQDDAVSIHDDGNGQPVGVTVNNTTVNNCTVQNAMSSTPAGVRIAGADQTFLSNNVTTNTYTSGIVISAGTVYRGTTTSLQNNTVVGAGTNTDGVTRTESVSLIHVDTVTASGNVIVDVYEEDVTGVTGI